MDNYNSSLVCIAAISSHMWDPKCTYHTFIVGYVVENVVHIDDIIECLLSVDIQSTVHCHGQWETACPPGVEWWRHNCKKPRQCQWWCVVFGKSTPDEQQSDSRRYVTGVNCTNITAFFTNTHYLAINISSGFFSGRSRQRYPVDPIKSRCVGKYMSDWFL